MFLRKINPKIDSLQRKFMKIDPRFENKEVEKRYKELGTCLAPKAI